MAGTDINVRASLKVAISDYWRHSFRDNRRCQTDPAPEPSTPRAFFPLAVIQNGHYWIASSPEAALEGADRSGERTGAVNNGTDKMIAIWCRRADVFGAPIRRAGRYCFAVLKQERIR